LEQHTGIVRYQEALLEEHKRMSAVDVHQGAKVSPTVIG
jgi:hypothetical protein